MRKSVTLREYLDWRDATKGCLTAKEVHYTLHSIDNKDIVITGQIPITPAHQQKVKDGWYSSAILAALDSTDFRAELPVTNNMKVMGDTAVSFVRTPTFAVTGLDLDEENAGACIRVFVEGRV